MDNMKKLANSKKNGIKTKEWDDTLSDLGRLKLSEKEQYKKIASRQSHNIDIAKAELIERLKSGQQRQQFSPQKSAKLRANGAKTMEQAIAEGTVAIRKAQKLRSDQKQNNISKVEEYFRNEALLVNDENNGCLDYPDHHTNGHLLDDLPNGGGVEPPVGEEEDSMVVARLNEGGSREATEANRLQLSPMGWQNLNSTIQLVVKTCEALWQQLEEERVNRERLHFQLQEQRSIIATLTSELLQVQEHQSVILKELQSARSNVGLPPSFVPRSYLDDQMGLAAGLGPRLDAESSQLSFHSSRFFTNGLTDAPRPSSALSGSYATDPLLPPSSSAASDLIRTKAAGLSQSSSRIDSDADFGSAIRDRIQFNNARVRLLRGAAAASSTGRDQPARLPVYDG